MAAEKVNIELAAVKHVGSLEQGSDDTEKAPTAVGQSSRRHVHSLEVCRD